MSDPTTNTNNKVEESWENHVPDEKEKPKKLTLKERMALKKGGVADIQEFKQPPPKVEEEQVYEGDEEEGYDENQDFVVFNIADKKKKEPKTKANTEIKPNDEVKKFAKEMLKSSDVENLVVDPKIYEIVNTKKDPMSIVFIGHVDSGKSTICGNILVRSGKVDPSDLRKYEQEAKENNRESWFMAYILDIDDSERQKGKTVEVGRATFELPTKRFTILDAPGHKNYVPNMIDGTAQADIACLVISSKTGEYESGFEKGGQTMEHALLAKAFNVNRIIVLVNKMDTDNWSFERYKMIQEQIGGYLTNVGYTPEQIEWVPISGLNGENIETPIGKEKAPWYNGKTFFEALDTSPVPPRNNDDNLRIPLLDRMKDQLFYLYGKIESGTIKEGQHITVMPSKTTLKIKAILNDEDKRILFAQTGEHVKIGVKGIEDIDIKRGNIVCNNEDFCFYSNEFEANLTLLDFNEKSLLSAGYNCVMHMHTTVEEISITHVVGYYDKANNNKLTKIGFLKNGQSGVVRIKCNGMLCMEKYSTNNKIGSFVLRDQGLTIGYGQVTKIKAEQKPKAAVIPSEGTEQKEIGKDEVKEKVGEENVAKNEGNVEEKAKEEKQI